MKKTKVILLSLILSLSAAFPAMAEIKPVTFTHPELGEIIKVTFSHRMPVITLYGYKYYEIMDTANTLCRGMKTGGMYNVSSKSLTPEAAMAAFFASVEGRGSEPAATAAYTGVSESYAGALAALPEGQRISALLLLNGFSGLEGYEQLKSVPGFENTDTAALAAGYLDYTVDMYGRRIHYRVLMFSITESDGTFYMERYCFLRPGKVWRLHEITREYVNEYNARTRYIHGVAGSVPDELTDVNAQILRGLEWGMTPEAIAALEKTAVTDGAVSVNDTLLYRQQTRLDCVFTDNGLSGMKYTFTGANAYFAAFVSLYMRYADPAAIDKDNTITWSLENFTITLRYDANSPVLEVTPRIAL
jgi:hypothetical protein